MTSDAARAARQAATHWLEPGTAVRLTPLGDGYINDTWLMAAAGRQAVLQRINAHVFPEPQALMAKVAAVVAHLPQPPADGRRHGVAVPGLLPTATGAVCHVDGDGNVWRVWQFVSGTRCLQRLESAAQAEAAGRAFGALQVALADLPGEVPDPIPGFLQLDHYLALLDQVLEARGPGQAEARGPGQAEARGPGQVEAPRPGQEAGRVLAAISARRDLAKLFGRRDRLIHGDCKVDNLLFHAARDEVVCVIDLDTVMRGNWAWDFGDLVRSAAADLPSPGGAIGFSVDRFAAAVRGFVGSGAAARDLDALVMAPRYVALMLAVRFLTDHLDGDRYFKVRAPGDNLQRALQQLDLVRAMEARERDMRASAAAA